MRMWRSKAIWNFIGVLFLFQASPAMAQPEKASHYSTVSLYLENDFFAGTDQGYTSGVKLAWISPDLSEYRENRRIPRWSYPLIKRLPFVNRPGRQRALSLSMGQNIYTPQDIEQPRLIVNDRPYAGITYLTLGFHSRNERRVDTVEFAAGIVGPHSFADETQTILHNWFEATEPEGWRHQLRDEPVLNVFYRGIWKVLKSEIGKGFSYDLVVNMGGGLGNVATYADAGTEVRFGWNLPNDFGTFMIRPACGSNVPYDERDPRFFSPRRRMGIHLFGALGGTAVLQNIFLDGNSFRDSHQVGKRVFVGNAMWGIGLIVHHFKISYAYVHQTKEFRGEGNEQVYGTITVSYLF